MLIWFKYGWIWKNVIAGNLKVREAKMIQACQVLPCTNRHNSSPWILCVLFMVFLTCVQRRMAAQNHKIPLFLYKCVSPPPMWNVWHDRVNHQTPLGNVKFYFKLVWKPSKLNYARYVLQEEITFQNSLSTLTMRTEYVVYIWKPVYLVCC